MTTPPSSFAAARIGLDVALVLLQQRPERLGDVGLGGDLGQRPADQIPDEPHRPAPGSRLFSIQVISRSAGSFSSTGIWALGNSAPSMISAHSISSATGAGVEAELRRPRCRARNLAQLLAVGS